MVEAPLCSLGLSFPRLCDGCSPLAGRVGLLKRRLQRGARLRGREGSVWNSPVGGVTDLQVGNRLQRGWGRPSCMAEGGG